MSVKADVLASMKFAWQCREYASHTVSASGLVPDLGASVHRRFRGRLGWTCTLRHLGTRLNTTDAAFGD